MIDTRRHFNLLSHAWLVTGLSLLVLIALGVLLWSPWNRRAVASTKPLHLYCAVGLRKPVAEIISAYEKEHGVQVVVDYASSGELLSTIRARQGETDADPGDLYLANDILNMRDAQKKYGVVSESIPVAINSPVLVVSKQTQETLKKQGKKPISALSDLERKDLKVVLAMESASIGKMARKILEPSGAWGRLEQERKSGSNRVSQVGTVEQVAQDVRLREGTIGIVWYAIARQHPELEVVTPPEFEDVSEQAMIGVLTQSRQPTAALQFARYLTASDKGQKIFEAHHFKPIEDADEWAKDPKIILSAGAMLMPSIEEVIKGFQEREGAEVKVIPGGCGVLVSQMKAIKSGGGSGKFPDAYFACDVSFLDDVQQWFGPGVKIAQNDVILIVPKGNPKAVKPSLREMARKDLRIGVPHPTNSALGKLADDLLKKKGWHGEVYTPDWRDRIVHTDAAHDLVNKMRTGALDLAVVYRSNALSTPANVEKHLDILELDGARATQPFAIARETRHRYLVQRLLDAIVAKQSADRFKDLGFRWVYEAK